jgi:hypothetical protein
MEIWRGDTQLLALNGRPMVENKLWPAPRMVSYDEFRRLPVSEQRRVRVRSELRRPPAPRPAAPLPASELRQLERLLGRMQVLVSQEKLKARLAEMARVGGR